MEPTVLQGGVTAHYGSQCTPGRGNSLIRSRYTNRRIFTVGRSTSVAAQRSVVRRSVRVRVLRRR